MSIDPDVVAAAVVETAQHLATGIPTGWTRVAQGALAFVSGVAVPTLNGVWVDSADVNVETIADLLDEIAGTGLPHCLQARPGAVQQVDAFATGRGMTRDDHLIPLMVLDDPGDLGARRPGDSLVIRELSPAEASRHARLAAAGFEAPEEAFLQLMTPSALAVPGVRCYLGEVGGQAVTTGFGVVLGPHVGIFNIATPPAHRRRGYGAAVTARAVADGLEAGAKWAWLQASEAGYPVYERLGFRTSEAWSCWVSPSSLAP